MNLQGGGALTVHKMFMLAKLIRGIKGRTTTLLLTLQDRTHKFAIACVGGGGGRVLCERSHENWCVKVCPRVWDGPDAASSQCAHAYAGRVVVST